MAHFLLPYETTLEVTSSYPINAWSLLAVGGGAWTDANITLNNFLPKSTHILSRSDVHYSVSFLLRATVSVGYTFDHTIQIRVCGEEGLAPTTTKIFNVYPYDNSVSPNYVSYTAA
jgi:hypothetical protein